MAIDKRNSPVWVKVVIWVVIGAFVLLGIGVSLPALFGGGGTTTSPDDGLTGSTNASDTISAISKEYAAQAEAIDAQIAADPENADLLLGQANVYLAWANAILSATNTYTEGRPMAVTAVQYFERAFAITPGGPDQLKDYAAALFYSGDTGKAISTAEGIVAKDPKFAPAYFNLGVFYGSSGRFADAIKAYQTALDLDPQGADAEELKARIQALQQEAAASSTASPTP